MQEKDTHLETTRSNTLDAAEKSHFGVAGYSVLVWQGTRSLSAQPLKLGAVLTRTNFTWQARMLRKACRKGCPRFSLEFFKLQRNSLWSSPCTVHEKFLPQRGVQAQASDCFYCKWKMWSRGIKNRKNMLKKCDLSEDWPGQWALGRPLFGHALRYVRKRIQDQLVACSVFKGICAASIAFNELWTLDAHAHVGQVQPTNT